MWLIQYNDKGKLFGVFRTPTGVFVNRGLLLQTKTDGPQIRVDYEQCATNQCQAVFEIAADLVKGLSGAKDVNVTLALVDGQTVTVKLGMDGFTAALAALASKAKR